MSNCNNNSPKHGSLGKGKDKLPLEEIDELDELITAESEEFLPQSTCSRQGSLSSMGSKRLIDKALGQNFQTSRRRFDSADYFLDAALEEDGAPASRVEQCTKAMELELLEVAPWIVAETFKGPQPKDWIKERSRSHDGLQLSSLECRL